MWRASTGHWYVRGITGSPQWGTRGDIPVPGDYTGAGATQRAIWRPSNGRWYVNDGRAFLSYTIEHGVLVVSGDPVGHPAALGELVRDLRAFAEARGLRIGVVGAGEASCHLFESAGMRALCYTVNDPYTARWLVGCAIDGIITDAVDRFSPHDGAVVD